jgi:GntR family transcriptional regulator
MEISLSKSSDVPLRQQLTEQIVFLITTGQLRPGEQLPSVRALARRAKVHHNTVSEAYQDLVRRNWLTRQRGSRLIVGGHGVPRKNAPLNLDELINESIQRAKEMGFSLQALSERVRERLLTEPPDHVLVVEEDTNLREIIQREVQEKLGWRAEGCTPEQFARDARLAVGAQVFAPSHIVDDLRALIPQSRPAIAIAYSGADEHLRQIRELKKPSIIAAVSISDIVLRTARGLFAPAVGRKHAIREFVLPKDKRLDLSGADLAICDSLSIARVKCRRKILYQLVAPACLEYLGATVGPPVRLSRA